MSVSADGFAPEVEIKTSKQANI